MQTTSNTEENFILWLVSWYCTNDHSGNQFYLANNIIKDILKKVSISHWHDPNAWTISWILELNIWVNFLKLMHGMSLNTSKYFCNVFTWICTSIILTVYENKSCYFKFRNMVDSTILSVEAYNTISGSIQYYQWKYTILSAEVYNAISGSIQYYQWKYTILSVEEQYTVLSMEVYNTISGSIQCYQWKYTILSVEVYNTISGRTVYNTVSGSIRYYQNTILSVEIHNTTFSVFCWCYTALVQGQSSICWLPFEYSKKQ